MSVSDLIFRPEAVTVVTVIGASIVVGKSLMKLQEASKDLGKQLRKLDRRIAKKEEGIPQTRERIKDLAMEIKPLKNKVRTLNLYYDKLNEIDHEGEVREGREAEKKEIKPRGRADAPDTGRRPSGSA
jgi:chromosome segregation ATPase